ncbi:MAG: hypothetical protein JO219_06560 [Candidatus Eremiobacteraeota bacterium]|nr:hypothetical protein [Candidatus Eremiobacteraeota bacterium]MBV8366749.1 hypothetical protein [Candidatus Eremiobacteraeota bacterium]
MQLAALADPIFIAKVIDFGLLIVVIVFIYQRVGKAVLVAQQEAQNKAVADAVALRAAAAESVEAARKQVEQAKLDAVHMIDVGRAQGQHLIVAANAEAQEHAARIVAHANGELERERYRVRRELLEDTVERATARARDIVASELTPQGQHRLIEGLVEKLESGRA